jgi:antitoxin component of MazEF toxin-antitoxin module
MSSVKVRRVGNSLGILIPSGDLRSAGIKVDDVLSLAVDGSGRLVLEKVSEAKSAAVAFMDRYDAAFRKLAAS